MEFYNSLGSDDRSVFRLLLALSEFDLFDHRALSNVRAKSIRYIMIGAYFDTEILSKEIKFYQPSTVEIDVSFIGENDALIPSKVVIHREEFALDTCMSLVAPYFFDDVVNGDSVDYRLTISQCTEVFNTMFMPSNPPSIVIDDISTSGTRCIYLPSFHGFGSYEAMDVVTRQEMTFITWADLFDSAKTETGLKINIRIPDKVTLLSMLQQMIMRFCCFA
jgi:hypothetical protein